MKISDEKVVSLIYTLMVDGVEADRADNENPLEFIFGLGYLLPKFEENISGLEPGEKFAFTLSPKEGYGEYVEEAVVDLPKSVFEIDGKIQDQLLVPGNVIRMMNQQGGVVPGKVVSVDDENVKMDFNAPMAGKTLDFTGEIVSVRDATEAELTDGLHGERSCGGGDGCNCDSCSCEDCH